MVAGLLFDSIEDFNVVNDRVTVAAKQVYELDNYSLPVEVNGKYFMQVVMGYEQFFTEEELNSLVDYFEIKNA
jgi:hypothetical protein